MKNGCLLLCLIIIAKVAFSQNISFKQVPPVLPETQNIAPFKTLTQGDIVYVDIDNDNDLDVLITGLRSLTIGSTAEMILYINDGDGNYSEVPNTNFDAISYGAIACADVDNDNDQDILIVGNNHLNQTISKLYLNNGNYTFTLSTNTSFIAVENGDAKFADIDNDNDMDVLITGRNGNTSIANLYKNNGSGSFTLVTGTSFLSGEHTQVEFVDIDNDSDLDIFIHKNLGYSSSYNSTSKLYKNNGSGSFTLVKTFNTNNSSFAFGDIDGDNDLDLVFAGRRPNHGDYPKLYKNNGSGVYTSVGSTPFARLYHASIGFIDYDNDNDLDFVMMGDNLSNKVAKLYINDSIGNYSTSNIQPFKGASEGQLTFIDVDTNSYMDIIVSGVLSGSYSSTIDPVNLYVNDSASFSLAKGSPFYGIAVESIDYLDIDGDNDQDIFIKGILTSNSQTFTRFYINDGSGGYTPGSSFPAYCYGKVFKFADIDNDNDLDVLITGGENLSTAPSPELYKNNGSGVFTLFQGNNFLAVKNSIVEFGDVDNDNDLDVIISGNTSSSSQYIIGLYLNNGSGYFSLVQNTSFIGMARGEAAFADVDGDNDLDLFITGNTSGTAKFLLYLNNGSGGFSLSNNTSFTLMNANFDVADIDGDNDLDLIMLGNPVYSSAMEETILYKNNGSGVFTIVSSTPFSDLNNGAVAFGDFDNDNDNDVIITGNQYNVEKILTELYANDGSGNFTFQQQVTFAEVDNSSITILDIDNDSKKDVIITGHRNSNDYIARLYRNTSCNTLSVDSITACQSYTWIDGITYTENNNTAFYILPNSAGCDSIVRLSLTIDSVNVNTIVSDPVITAVATNASYQWLDCGNNYTPISSATSQSFTAKYNGSYAVKVSQNNCTDTSLCVLIINAGIESNTSSENVYVFPNPNSGVVNIFLGNLKNVSVSVFDVSGKKVYQKDNINLSYFKFNLDVHDGLYFLEISNEFVKQRFKIIKKSAKE